MGKKYTVTVIGAGDRGGCYMNMLKKYHSNDIIFSGICDILPDRLEKAYDSFGFESKYIDWKEAITATKPDIVVIATPAYYHCDMAAFAMDNGCHVLTEKPFDLDLKKCYMLKEKQEQTKKVLAIGLQYRNGKFDRIMKHIIDRKLLGKNIIMSYTDIRPTRPKIAMHDAQYGNGGPLVDMSCHLLDLMRWFYNSNPKYASAIWAANATDRPTLASIDLKAPDACIMTIEYESGDYGAIVMNWGMPSDTPGDFLKLATGSEGYIAIQNAAEGITVVSGKEKIVVNIEESDKQDLIDAELAVYDHFIAEIEGRGKVQAAFDEGIYSLATSMAAIKSGVLRRPVTIAEILESKPTVAECMKE